jgi:translocation and assembly module TamB
MAVPVVRPSNWSFPMRFLRRALLSITITLVVLAIVGWFILRVYLRSDEVRQIAAVRLAEIIGLPVEVDGLNVGLTSSSLSFRVVQLPINGEVPLEIMRVESATTDVSLADLVTGRVQPKIINVRGLDLTLHFDAEGRLITKLPQTNGNKFIEIPAIEAEAVTLKIRQQGRPEFRLTNANINALPRNGRVALRGHVNDSHWGPWDANGEFDVQAETIRLQISTEAAPLNIDLLRSIPFVPVETWNYVQPSGSTAAHITLVSQEEKFQYEVVLTPSGAADVRIPIIDTSVMNVVGTISIYDAKIELANCVGHLADGNVRLGGKLDFDATPSVLKFQVGIQQADIKKLPAEWGLPRQLEGRLRGEAELVITVPEEGPIVPRGGGSAVVEEARFAGFPAEVMVRLQGDGQRYRFDTTEPPVDIDRPKSSRTNPHRSNTVVTSAIRRTIARPIFIKSADKNDETEPTTLDATVRLRDVDITELLTRLEIDIPYRLGGQFTIEATVTIPVAQVDDLRSYRFAGTLTSSAAQLEELTIRDFSAQMEYAKGVLKLSELRGTVPPSVESHAGTFYGKASAEIVPRGTLSASLTLNKLPLSSAVKAIPDGNFELNGTVTGQAEFRAPIDNLEDATTWGASAEVTSEEIGVFGRILHHVAIQVKLDAGVAVLTDARAIAEGLPISADAKLHLTQPYKFAGVITTSPIDAADIRRLIAEEAIPFTIKGRIDTRAKVFGTLDPFILKVEGTAHATDLQVGTSKANEVELKWELDQERVKVTKLSASLFNGAVTGTADIPLDVTEAGRFTISFKQLDATEATQSVPNFPLRLSGRVSGQLAAKVPAAKPGDARMVSADLDLTAPRLTVQGVPTERLVGKVSLVGGGIEYNLEGRALGGSFEVRGRYPSKLRPNSDKLDDRGSFNIRDVQLQRLAEVFRIKSLRLMRGQLDLTLTFNNNLTDGSGRIAVSNLGWGFESLATDLTGNIRLRDGVIVVPDFTGRLAGGLLRARGQMSMTNLSRNEFHLAIDRADAKRLFVPIPDLADAAAGDVSVVLHGRLGAEIHGTGEITFDRGILFGLNAKNLRMPFDWIFGTGGSGKLTIRQATANVGYGRLSGDASYTWGMTNRLAGNMRFSDLRLQSLLGETRLFGNGRITGRFDFGGANVRSINDVSGTLTASLNQASVQELPILRQLTPYLAPREAVRPFQTGEVRGRLGGGIFRIDRLALVSPTAELFSEGTVTVAGRLDMDVIVNTGRIGLDDRPLLLLGLRLPAVGPVPLSIIRDVSDILSNRTLRLHVTGTVNQPVVRVDTAALLSEEAVRFFLTRYVPAAIATGGVSTLILPAALPRPQEPQIRR